MTTSTFTALSCVLAWFILYPMADSNPYRSPLAHIEAQDSRPTAVCSLAIGLLIDGVGALLGAIWLSQLPGLRVLLPFAAAHAAASVLIVGRARSGARRLSAGDHFFLRYGALMMAAATTLVRVWI